MTTTSTADIGLDVTSTGARRRTDSSLPGRLNVEWARLRHDPATAAVVRRWSEKYGVLSTCGSLADVESRVASSPDDADDILLALLVLAQSGDSLAGRTVLQLMLGKAIRIAASRAGVDTRHELEQAAVSALWTTIATYPVARRPIKVAANLAMDTLRKVSSEVAHHRTESPTEPDDLDVSHAPSDDNSDVDLVNLLMWAVEQGTVTAADATLILDVYSPASTDEGGAAAAARHGLGWAAARQRCSRAVRKISRAISADVPLT